MANLYDIADRYNNILALTDNDEVDFNLFAEALNAISDEFENKADNIVFMMKELDGTAKMIKEEEARLAARRKSVEKSKENLKNYLEQMMLNTNKLKFKTTLNTYSIVNNKPSVIITNGDLIPENFKTYEQVCKIDKNEIYTAIKNGETIDGAELQENQSLRIK